MKKVAKLYAGNKFFETVEVKSDSKGIIEAVSMSSGETYAISREFVTVEYLPIVEPLDWIK